MKKLFLLLGCVLGLATAGQASSHSLNADPNYSFGAIQPSTPAMRTGVGLRMGVTISQVTSLPLEDVNFAPNLASAPFTYGPSSSGRIKNLNLNTNLITGIVSGKMRYSGTTVVGGVTFNKFVLRVFTATQFHDIQIEVMAFSGTPSSYGAGWAFTKISSPRAISLLP